MGLNMDVDHVAFAGLGKYDGHRPRRLTAAEIAQIAGRAGRGMRDGTFGTTGRCPPMPDELVEEVETHSFDPLEQLYWRNSDLDFSQHRRPARQPDASPPGPDLVRGNDAVRLETLPALSRDPDIRKLAQGRAPHAAAVGRLPDPRLPQAGRRDPHPPVRPRLRPRRARQARCRPTGSPARSPALDRPDGDIDTLMQRLTGVRVWSYIAARPDWVRTPLHWQARAREVEDQLSDALHERLTTRFVDRRAAHLMRRLRSR